MRAMSEQSMQSPSEPSLEVKASLARSYTPTRTNSRQTASKLLQLPCYFTTWARSEVVITPPCHGGDRRFKSGQARQSKRPKCSLVFTLLPSTDF